MAPICNSSYAVRKPHLSRNAILADSKNRKKTVLLTCP